VAELQPPVALQNVATLNSDDFRGLIQALVPTEGIIASGDLAVTQNGTPNMSVNVAAGAAVIVGDDTPATQGSYFVKNDATKNLTVTAADPTNPRKDIVIAQVRDSFYSGSDNDWRLAVIAGTPAASPSEPSLPNNALKLAVISVVAGATSITTAVISNTRPIAQPLAGARGTLGFTPHAADTAVTTSYADIVSVSVTTVAGRRYKITGHVNGSISAADHWVIAKLVEGATLFGFDSLSSAGFTFADGALHMEAVVTPSAGPHTYKVQAVASLSGIGTIADSTNGPGFILVEDVGV
jgi:hypothetical protein